jgi:acyl carrier protein
MRIVISGCSSKEAIAQIWSDVLRVDRVGIHDDFFHLGGHSLLATQVISRMNELFGRKVPLRCLFELSTVAGLARVVGQAAAAADEGGRSGIRQAPRGEYRAKRDTLAGEQSSR